AALALTVAGCAASPSASAPDAGQVPQVTPVAGAPSTIPGAGATVPAAGAGAAPAVPPAAPSPPTGVAIPALGVDARVVPVPVDDRTGELTVPEDVRLVGWWEQGPAPGARYGTVVLTGHIDSAEQGPGALARLRDVGPGDRVAVRGGGGTTAYVVQARREYHKADLPVEVFSSVGRPRLVIISCGGPFDERTRHYRDNIVVYATPA
ncbi:MAG TPA: class F sortase, partial [Frankiaceae bacterium]|nr:class F sortase [Frankiaceae bacterium]